MTSLFFNEDCISGSKHIPSGSIDLIITDPPFAINGGKLDKHYNRNEEFVVNGYVEIPQKDYADFSINWIKEAERLLKPGGSLYIISGYTNLVDILNALRKTNLKEINHIIWKYNFGVFTRTKYISSHYHILFYEKPGGKRTFNLESRYGLSEKTDNDRSLNNFDREDVWVINREFKPGQLKNKNELPLELLIKMIQYSSNEHDTVCDLFLGGFSTAKAAIGLNRNIIGFEISKDIFDIRSNEIKSLEPGYLLPSIRQPVIKTVKNFAKAWSNEELIQLNETYNALISQNIIKKQIITQLSDSHQRGKWAIIKALKKITPK